MYSARAANAGASPFVLLTLAPFFWACNWIIGRGLSGDIPPFAMTFYRWLFALAILAPFALPRVRRDWPLLRANWKAMLLLGAIGIGSTTGPAFPAPNSPTATTALFS